MSTLEIIISIACSLACAADALAFFLRYRADKAREKTEEAHITLTLIHHEKLKLHEHRLEGCEKSRGRGALLS
jgi:hypothetical protein